MNDKQIINQLNKQHGWNLKQVDSIESSGYVLNDNDFVTGLNLSNNYSVKISFLSVLSNLTHLVLNNDRIRDITPLKNLKNLIWLDLNDNQIGNIEVLQELTNLKRLELYNNRISDIKPIANLVKIELLVLAINRIKNITPLSKLTKLWHLKIYDNLISDLKPLRNLKSLTMLGINKNLISDISPLAELYNLDTIVILDNQISDISPLKNLNKLKRLDLQSNKITELPVWITNFNMDIGFNDSHGELDLNYNSIIKPPIDIVEQGKKAIKRYFESIGAEMPETPRVASNDENTTTNKILGSKSRTAREATEKVINIKEYAKVLAKLFKNATGEFNFGLFGAWGRGKTFLINEVKDILIEDNYEVVIFDAWKYKRQPQVWAHLYESCVEQFVKSPKLEWKDLGAFFKNVWQTIIHFFNIQALKLRYGIIKNGYNKIIWALVVLIIGFTNHYLFKSDFNIIEILGGLTATIVSVYLIYKVGNSFNNFRKTILKEYTNISSYKRELGLQDTIGKDLKYLLTALAKRNKHILNKIVISLLSIFAVVFVYFFIDNISGKHIIWNLYFPEVVGWLKWLLTILSTVFLVFFNTLIWWTKEKKTCIIIDNLDRCKPDEMLEVIESIRLLLEDDKLVNVLQTVMLIDEDKLRYAIAEKYSHHITINKDNGNNTEIDLKKRVIEKYDLVVDEQINKLFISYLRLSNLTKNETLEIITSVLREYALLEEDIVQLNRIGEIFKDTDLFDIIFNSDKGMLKRNLNSIIIKSEKGQEIRSKIQQDLEKTDGDAKLDTKKNTMDSPKEDIVTDIKEDKNNSSFSDEYRDTYFTIKEEKQIIKSIQKIYDINSVIVNPRFIRSFTFKYFLVRDLFQELNIIPDVSICMLLEKAVSEKAEKRNNKNTENNTTETSDAEIIIKQVV